MNKLQTLVKQTYDRKPETIANNNLLWIEVCKRLCCIDNIESIDDFYLAILKNQIPSSHSLAAAISCVRKKYPEYHPTDEQKEMKEVSRQKYIEDYKNS